MEHRLCRMQINQFQLANNNIANLRIDEVEILSIKMTLALGLFYSRQWKIQAPCFHMFRYLPRKNKNHPTVMQISKTLNRYEHLIKARLH